MKFKFFILIILACLVLISCNQTKPTLASWTMFSPDRKIAVTLQLSDGKLFYTARIVEGSDTVQVLENSPLGISLSKESLAENLSFVSSDSSTFDEEYVLIS